MGAWLDHADMQMPTHAEEVPGVLDALLAHAATRGISDIHLDPTAEGLALRLRRDGALHEAGLLPKHLSDNVIARCKVLARLLTYRTDVPQDGSFRFEHGGRAWDMRLATFPTHFGERAVFRIFHGEECLRGMGELGLSGEVFQALSGAVLRPEGAVYLSGPCGAGKTTTLYACLLHIQTFFCGEKSIITIEDPVENALPGIIQTAVNAAAGMTFSGSLSRLLRQDPDVLMLGEVRDAETAGAATEAALTGHLVLASVHASRASDVPHRLLDMEVEPYALAGTFSLAVAQRLMRLACRVCAEGTRATCPACLGTGHAGRRMIAEYLPASDRLHDAIMRRSPRGVFRGIAATYPPDLDKAAEALLEDGLTTEQEIRRVLATGVGS